MKYNAYPVLLSVVDAYLKKSKNRAESYNNLISAVQTALKGNKLSPSEQIALVSLD